MSIKVGSFGYQKPDKVLGGNMYKSMEKLKKTQQNLQEEINQLKEKETQLQKSLLLLRSTLESTAHGIITVNLTGDILSCNQKFVEMWQMPNSLMQSQKYLEYQAFFENQLKNPEAYSQIIRQVCNQYDRESYDILELKDGRFFAQYSQPQWLDEEIIGRVWSIWDVTESHCTAELPQLNRQSKLKQTLGPIKQLTQLQGDFISRLCHQLRTPLNVVSFSNSLLTRHISGWNEEKIQPLLVHIQTGVEEITKMLDDVLLLANVEAGKVNYNAKPLNLVAFCNQLIAQMQTSGSRNRINFLPQGDYLTVCIDQKLLEPMIINLLDNAMKYSPSHSVVDLKLYCEGGKVVFLVTDRGIGIPIVDRQRLFEPFYRGSNIHHQPGTGLGLSIVKTLVELQGGDIVVDSEVDVSTTFKIMLPIVTSQL
jgi:signal transduction histidine kinase